MGAVLEIPLPSAEASFRLRTTLEGREYVLGIHWNGRMERWILDLYDANDTPIVTGQPLHIDSDILMQFTKDELPPGMLMLYDTSGKHEEAGRDDLGSRAKLLYRESV